MKENTSSEKRPDLLGGCYKAQSGAIQNCFNIQNAAAEVGFNYHDAAEIWKKIEEETFEVREAEVEARATQDKSHLQEELGDLFFCLVNLCMQHNINPKQALETSNEKFIRRFEIIEEYFSERGIDLSSKNQSVMDEGWEEAKKQEENQTPS